MADNKITSSGVGIIGLLGILFITLKLTNVITWSWWWVTCPFWAGTAITIAVIMVTIFLLSIALLIDTLWKS